MLKFILSIFFLLWLLTAGLPGTALATQLIAEDLVVQGSLGVGSDMPASPAFGFDTLVFRENNLRIFFDDTSLSPFPNNDWRITINSSLSGGGSYFSIDDATAGNTPFKIEAGAGARAFHVDSTGMIGLGTATPALELHIRDGDTPGVRLDQDTSVGWSAQIWDVAGNETNFFIRDGSHSNSLPFRIQAGAPSNTLTVRADGNVGIGTWAPAEALHVEGNAYVSGNLELGCSRDLKENIAPVGAAEARAALDGLAPVKYNYKSDPTEQSLGFIAEEVPDLVAVNSRKRLSPMDVTAVLVKVVQEQQRTIETLSRRVAQLEQALAPATAAAHTDAPSKAARSGI